MSVKRYKQGYCDVYECESGELMMFEEHEAQLAALKEDNERLREIEHRAWHLLDEAVDDGSGELKISMHNNADLDELNKLLPEDYHRDSGERISIRAERDALKARVAKLEVAASSVLEEIRTVMTEAYNSAYPVCCGRPGEQCCGNPEPEWHDFDRRMMDRFTQHERSLASILCTKEPTNEG